MFTFHKTNIADAHLSEPNATKMDCQLLGAQLISFYKLSNICPTVFILLLCICCCV